MAGQPGVDTLHRSLSHLTFSIPHSKLKLMLRDIAVAEAQPGLKFKIMEGGGRMVKRVVQKSNPTASGSYQGELLGMQRREGLSWNIQEVQCGL